MYVLLPHGGRPAPRRRARGGGSAALRRVLYLACSRRARASLGRLRVFAPREEAGLDGFDAFVRRALREREEAEDPRKEKERTPAGAPAAPPPRRGRGGGGPSSAPAPHVFPARPAPSVARGASSSARHVRGVEGRNECERNGRGARGRRRPGPRHGRRRGAGATGAADWSVGFELGRGEPRRARRLGLARHGGARRGGEARLPAQLHREPPHSFNPRPRKLTRVRPQPLAAAPLGSGAVSVSPGTSASPARTPAGSTMEHALGGFRPGGGSNSNAPAPLVGFGGRTEGSGSEARRGVCGTRVAVGRVARGRPRPRGRRTRPRLASPGANAGGGGIEVERRTAARQTGRARGRRRGPEGGDRDPGRGK